MATMVRGAAAGLLMIVLASCSTVRVTEDHDPRANFGQYRTFRLAACQSNGCGATLLRDRVAAALADELQRRGLQPDPARSDVIVMFSVVTATKADLVQPTGAPPWGGLGGDIWSDEIRQGTVLINVVDARTSQTVWTARAQTEQPDFASAAVVRTTVARAMSSYPPRS
jgi:hypothetical protein